MRKKTAKAIELSTDDKLAMFRCVLYTKMCVSNDEQKPTDRQCIEWLQRVCCQAEHRNNPALTLIAHEPVKVKTETVIPEIEIRRWDVEVLLPEWRDLQA